MDNAAEADSELSHCAGDEVELRVRVDAHDLRGGSGGIGEWAGEIEDGAETEAATYGLHALHGGMQSWSVEESESCGAEAVGGLLGREGDENTHGFEDIGGSAFGGDAAVAVLGDFGSGGCGNKGGSGGDVEGAEAIASGSAGVDEGGALVGVEGDGDSKGAHGLSEAGELVDGLAAGGERGEERADFEVGDCVGVAGEDCVERAAGLFAGERAVLFGDLFEKGLECGHRGDPMLLDLVRAAGGGPPERCGPPRQGAVDQSPAEVPGRGSYSGLAGTAWEVGTGFSAKKLW